MHQYEYTHSLSYKGYQVKYYKVDERSIVYKYRGNAFDLVVNPLTIEDDIKQAINLEEFYEKHDLY